jgi:hypothetical protein
MIVSLKFAEMLVDLKKAGIPFISRSRSQSQVPDNVINYLFEFWNKSK